MIVGVDENDFLQLPFLSTAVDEFDEGDEDQFLDPTDKESKTATRKKRSVAADKDFDHDDGNPDSKGGKKRKRDFVQGLIDKCKKLEQENSSMKATLNNMDIKASDIELKRNERFNKLRKIVAAFNEGDISEVNSVISDVCSPTCVLITPSIFQELNGFFAITKFFTVLLEAFPDALMNIVGLQSEDYGVATCKFTFSGTKVFGLPTDVLFRQWRSSQEASNQPAVPSKAAAAGAGATASTRRGGAHVDPVTLKMFDDLIAHNEALKSTAASATTDDKENPTVKISGHMFLVFDVKEKISRLVFVWNTTSLMGQVLGHTDDNLSSMSKFFSEALSQFKGNGGMGPGGKGAMAHPGASSSSSTSSRVAPTRRL